MNIQRQFEFLLIYFWIIASFVDYANEYSKSGLKYHILVAPIVLFIAINNKQLYRSRYNSSSIILLVYFVCICSLSLARHDMPTLYSAIAFCIPIIIMLNSQIHLNFKLCNILFLLSICISVIYYYLGWNPYGYFPGQSTLESYQGLTWRISLFSYNTPPYSGAFALMIFIVNYFLNHGKSKIFFLVLSLYYLIFSGSRTALIILLVVMFFIIVSKKIEFRNRFFYKIFPIVAIVVFVLTLYAPNIFMQIKTNNVFVNTFIFRSEEGLDSSDELSESINRTIIWERHMDQFFIHPMIGSGSSFENEELSASLGSTGSESLLTRIIARDGSLSLLFLSFLLLMFVKAVALKDRLMYSVNIVFCILLLTYGSFLNTYSFVFLLILGFINGGQINAVQLQAESAIEES